MKMNNFKAQVLFAPDTGKGDLEELDDTMDEGEGSDFADDFASPLGGSSEASKKADKELEEEEDDFVDENDLDDSDDEDISDDDEEDEEEEEEDQDEEDEEDEEDASNETEKTTKAFLLKTIDTLSSGLDLNDVQAGEVVDQSFISDKEFESFQTAESATEMNKIFNNIYKKIIAVSDTRANKIAGNKVAHQVQTATTTDNFYRSNPELADVKELVISKAKTIFAKSEDKDLTLADLLDKAGTEVREALGLKKSSKSKDDKKSSKAPKKRVRKSPRVPGTRGGGKTKRRASSKQKSGLEAELDMFSQHNKKTRSL